MNEAGRSESCSKCGSELRRIYTPSQILYAGVQESYFCNGLGTVVKGRDHRKELAARKGMIEIGNEKPETIEKEAAQTLQKRLKSYDD